MYTNSLYKNSRMQSHKKKIIPIEVVIEEKKKKENPYFQNFNFGQTNEKPKEKKEVKKPKHL